MNYVGVFFSPLQKLPRTLQMMCKISAEPCYDSPTTVLKDVVVLVLLAPDFGLMNYQACVIFQF